MKGVEDMEQGHLQARLEALKQQKKAAEAGTTDQDDGNKWYDQLFKKTKEWFEAEPDSDL